MTPCVIQKSVSSRGTERLQLLNEAQPTRPWHSCDEQRECLVCENIFTGHDVVLNREGITRLACPACDRGPECWVRPGNPLLDEHVWADWERAIADAEHPDDEDELATPEWRSQARSPERVQLGT